MERKENNNFKLNDNFLSILLVVCLSVLFIFLLINLGYIIRFLKGLLSIMMPIILGSVMAFMISPFYTKIYKSVFKILDRNKKIKSDKAKIRVAKSIGIVASVLLWIVLILGFIFLVIPEIYSSTALFMANLEGYKVSIKKLFDELEVPYAKEEIINYLNKFLYYINELFKDFEEFVDTNLLSNLSNIIKNIYSGVITTVNIIMNIGIGFIIMIYILYKKENIKWQLKKMVYALFKTENAKYIISECKFACDIFTNFFIGKIIDSAIIFILSYIIFSIMKLPYIFLLSLLIGVTNIVPFFGPIVGGIIATVLVLFASPDKVIVFAIAVFLIQQFDGNILGPKILGDATGVDNFYVLCAILVFGGLFGFIGMIIAVPLWAIIYRLVNQNLISKLKSKNLPTDSKDFENL